MTPVTCGVTFLPQIPIIIGLCAPHIFLYWVTGFYRRHRRREYVGSDYYLEGVESGEVVCLGCVVGTYMYCGDERTLYMRLHMKPFMMFLMY